MDRGLCGPWGLSRVLALGHCGARLQTQRIHPPRPSQAKCTLACYIKREINAENLHSGVEEAEKPGKEGVSQELVRAGSGYWPGD